ncbi:MAG: radical SAM protein [Turicibacter sp.]|nr:radical SAM protein [Turicibacter sp.]
MGKGARILMVSIHDNRLYSNIGIEQLTGYLRLEGWPVDIFYHHGAIDEEKIWGLMPRGYDLYGFSIHLRNHKCCAGLASRIKSTEPGSLAVFGGEFITRFYKEAIAMGYGADYFILGDGELPFGNLLSHLFLGTGLEMGRHIASSGDFEGKRPCCNGTIGYFPAYDYYEGDTLENNREKEHCLQSKTNICRGVCSFCTSRKGPCIFKEQAQLVEEVRHVASTYGVRRFFFTDDNLFDPGDAGAKNRVADLCRGLLGLGLDLDFKCYCKATTFTGEALDHDLLALMKKTGFKDIFVGIESGSDTDLVLYKKQATVLDNRRSIELIRSHGIHPIIGFICFNPYSTPETLKENYHFLKAMDPDNLFDQMTTILRVFKYTGLHQKMSK